MTAVAAACLLATPAAPQAIQNCDYVGSTADRLALWSQASRTFANGAIRVAALDTGGEPVCCSNHLMILAPDPNIGEACYVLSDRSGEGFRQVFVSEIESSYDPGEGLLLQVPVGRYDPDTGGVDPNGLMRVPVRINQATGVVNIEALPTHSKILKKTGRVLKKKSP